MVGIILALLLALTPAQYQDRIESRINDQRQSQGVSRLPHGPCVAGFAERRADYLSSIGYVYHRHLGRVARRCNAVAVGEILLHGRVSPRRAVRKWLQSKDHRTVLLSRRYDHIAAGAARDEHGAWVVSVLFIEH